VAVLSGARACQLWFRGRGRMFIAEFGARASGALTDPADSAHVAGSPAFRVPQRGRPTGSQGPVGCQAHAVLRRSPVVRVHD